MPSSTSHRPELGRRDGPCLRSRSWSRATPVPTAASRSEIVPSTTSRWLYSVGCRVARKIFRRTVYPFVTRSFNNKDDNAKKKKRREREENDGFG